MSEREVNTLKDYITALQIQNKAKQNQQNILHRELDALKEELAFMEQYYYQVKELKDQVAYLNGQLSMKDQLCQELLRKVEAMQDNNQEIEEWQQVFKAKELQLKEIESELKMAYERQNNLTEMVRLQKTMQEQQKNYNKDLRAIIQSKELQIQELKQQFQRNQTKSTQSASLHCEDISILVNNYEKLEQMSREREQKMREMEEHIDQLEYYNQSHQNALKTKDIQIKQLKIQLSYLQKQIDQPKRSREKSAYYSRSQVSTPKWQKEQPNVCSQIFLKKDKQNRSLFLNGYSGQIDKSQCSSITSQCTAKLNLRNNMLRRQNQMLLNNLSDDS